MTDSIDLEVPASIGNVGPGFDTLSIAVQLYLRLRARLSTRGSLAFDFGDRPVDGENFIERAFRTLAARDGAPIPSLEVEVQSDIPMRAGLGSSAAATVAGLRLYERVTGPRPIEELLAVATELEGHPDNAAAALLGGLVGSCAREDGRVTALASRWPAAIRFVIVTPEAKLSTADARKVLPARLDMPDAVFNLQRVALMLQALETGRHDLLREALRDRWHQPYRQPLVPGLDVALALDHPALLGLCLSGSGPSVVALAEQVEPIERLLASVYEAGGIPCTIRTLAVHQTASVPEPGAQRLEPNP